MKILTFKSIIVFIITILILYSAYWIFLSTQVRSKINSLANESNIISYDSIKITGFPYRMEAQIKNLNINDDTRESSFNAFSPVVKVDINPINLKKILVRTKVIKSHINMDDIFLDISMEEVRSAITTRDNILAEIIIAINKANIKFNNLELDTINKIYFKQESNEDFTGNINLSAEGSDLIASSSGGVKLELKGAYTLKQSKVNGNLKLEILDLSNNQNLFSAPIKIKDNVASFLFIPLIDLNELFYSF
tara:strand:- start:4320 stop:5069 length:750 start_codon:yes stop_codon:yes gene_type:complete